MIVQGLVIQGEGSTHAEFVVPQPRSPTQTLVADEAASIGVDVRYGGATTTVTSLEAGQGSVESLETDLKQTKQIYGSAYTTLIKKVKKLEKIAKSSQARRRAKIVVTDDEDDLEDPSKQGRKIAAIVQDPVSTVEKDVSTAEPFSTAGAAVTTASVAVSIVSPTRNTGVSTANDITMAEIMVYIRKSVVKDKGKGKMVESETVQTKTKLQ
ncbi:hypothetical protein Tco_1226873 [Tanacetum coccineum]